MTAPNDRDRDREMIEPPTGALRALLDDVRPSRPRIDWARVESKLFDEHGDVRAVRESARKSFAGPVAALLAMAAAFAVALTSPSHHVEPRAPKVSSVRAPLVSVDNGSAVHVGDSIHASANGAWIESKGRMKAHLAPNTHVRVLDDGERIQLALVEGAITAEIVPVPGGEPFAIDVGGRRVAVHGTRLHVAMLDGKIEVAVSEGSAVVGFARGDGRTEGPIVATGGIGHFTNTDTLEVVHSPGEAREIVDTVLASKPVTTSMKPTSTGTIAMINPSHPEEHPTAKKPGSPSNIGVGSSTTVAPSSTTTTPETPEVAPPPVAKGLSDGEIAPTFSRIRAALTKCIASTDSEKITLFSTNLTITIQANGVPAAGATFSPEVDAKYRECARKAVYNSGIFPAAPGSTTYTAPVTLGGK